MTKERIFIVVTDWVSFLLFLLTFLFTDDFRYWFFLGSLFMSFIGYHVVSILLIRRLNKEEVDKLCDEVLEEKIKSTRRV